MGLNDDNYDYFAMIHHLFHHCLADLDEWGERFIKSQYAKNVLPFVERKEKPTMQEMNEFLSSKEKSSIRGVWNSVGL